MSIETFKANGFKVHIEYDEGAESPREWEHGCELVMSHRRYHWPNDAGIDLDDYDGWDAVAEELTASHGALVIETVWAYDHSGIAFKTGARTGAFSDRWDSGVAGLAYVTRANWQATQGAEWTGSEADVARARELIASDVDEYGQWANGSCYGYRIVDEYGEEVDACWGYIGYDSVTEAATEAANGLGHEAKCAGVLNRKSGEIEHAGACPLHGIDG